MLPPIIFTLYFLASSFKKFTERPSIISSAQSKNLLHDQPTVQTSGKTKTSQSCGNKSETSLFTLLILASISPITEDI